MNGRDRAGYTLLEILTVIVLISSLAGISLGMLSRSGTDLQRSLTLVRDMARMARTHARFYRSPARLVMTPRPGIEPDVADGEYRRVSVFALQSAGEWNFDDGRAGGSRGIGGELGGGVIDDGGRIGKGLFADQDSQQHGVRVDVRTLATFDLRGGFVARCDVKLDERRACTILRLGEAWELGTDASGRLTGAVTMAGEGGKAGRRITLKGVRRVPLGEWFKAELGVDRQQARLRLDFSEEAVEFARDEDCHRDPAAWFVISDGGAPVPGVVDTVEVFAFEKLADEALPGEVEVPLGPGVLWFDAEGRIDRRRHAQLPFYVLRWNDVEEGIRFGPGGAVQ